MHFSFDGESPSLSGVAFSHARTERKGIFAAGIRLAEFVDARESCREGVWVRSVGVRVTCRRDSADILSSVAGHDCFGVYEMHMGEGIMYGGASACACPCWTQARPSVTCRDKAQRAWVCPG